MFGGDDDAFHGLGVLRHASGPPLALKHAEFAKLKAVSMAQLSDDFIEKLLGNAFDDDAFDTQLLCDAVNKLFFWSPWS